MWLEVVKRFRAVVRDESGISTHLGLNIQGISVHNIYFMLITDVKMLICSNKGKRARQGHYEV